ncbi:MAG: prepilin-type N-terminal cleavage/methylation domain-containing protein [Gammaproteobacteria bacterium]|nr:prepilin-type N-terminal cleavage/methylation domain-containing protein [Gammaproteobacteria bacterium]
MAYAGGQSRRRARGVTLMELMVGIAILAIVTGIAVPDFSRWVVDGRIREAAGHLQQDMQWARLYALKTNQPVYMQLEYQQAAGGQIACSWVDTLNPTVSPVTTSPAATATALLNGPVMTAARFEQEYPGVSCVMTPITDGGTIPATVTPSVGSPYLVAFYPDGTIRQVTAPPVASPPFATGNVLFEARTNAVSYAHWDVKYYGAGELRSCASSAQANQGNWPCALQ